MANGGSDSYPCSACGETVPADRTVCPSCSTWQRTATGPSAPVAPPAPPPGFAGAGPAPSGWATTAPTPAPASRRRSSGTIIAVIVIVIVVLAAGGWLATRPDDSSTASGSARSGASDSGRAGPGALIAGETSTTQAPATTTTSIPWLPAGDPASGLSWQLPGEGGDPHEDAIAFLPGSPGARPTEWSVGNITDIDGKQLPGVPATVVIWGPETGATQADVDEYIRFGRDLYRQAATPYPKALTIAGRPATAVDASTDQVSSYHALAVVDGAMVLVQVSAYNGEKADPAVFERLVASFTKG